MMALDENAIRSRSCPQCPICSARGVALYSGLHDRLFKAPGAWNYRKCSNLDCQLVWLDPMPVEEDIGKIYRDYFTHDASAEFDQSWAHKVYHRAVACYLAERYGYERPGSSAQLIALRWLPYLWPSHRPQIDVKVMYLRQRIGGRLLDVGCGNGWTMEALQRLGWQCEGVDFDPLAVKVAQSRRLKVRLGTPEAQGYPDETFDAVIMSHVIEHVPRPEDFLGECCRILKPGGQLTVLTPNAASLGHRVFGDSWLYLDPPRHLHVFTLHAMRNLAVKLRDVQARVFTTVRGTCWMLQGSRSIRRSGRFLTDCRLTRRQRLIGEMAEFFEWCNSNISQSAGEEIVMLANKTGPQSWRSGIAADSTPS